MAVRKQMPVRKVAKKPAPVVKRVDKRVAFPPQRKSSGMTGHVSPRKGIKGPSKFPSSMSESQKHRVSSKPSHRERVLMRATVRKAGVVSKDAPNSVVDSWLMQHGWLHSKGYTPPVNRVSKLSKSLGFKRRQTPKQLGIT